MPVICTVCQTENRDAAMFCHGCARKLPGFAATGPSLLDAMRPRRLAGDAASAGHRYGDASQNASRGFWIGLGAIMLLVALGFGGWFGYVTRKPPAEATMPVTVVPPSLPEERPSEAVPLGSSLGTGEAEVPATPSDGPGAVAPPPSEGAQSSPGSQPPPAPIQRRAAPATPATPAPAQTAPPRAAALDPRQGCQHLNFFAAARCEAAHCDQAAYTRHPRCDAVREDRRRDEARRNPTLGT